MLPQKYFQLAVITLFIDDANDNSPRFPVDQVVVSVSESLDLGSEINLDRYQAKDADIGTFPAACAVRLHIKIHFHLIGPIFYNAECFVM